MKTYYFNSHDNILSESMIENSVEVSELVATALLQECNIDFSWTVWNNTKLQR